MQFRSGWPSVAFPQLQMQYISYDMDYRSFRAMISHLTNSTHSNCKLLTCFIIFSYHFGKFSVYYCWYSDLNEWIHWSHPDLKQKTRDVRKEMGRKTVTSYWCKKLVPLASYYVKKTLIWRFSGQLIYIVHCSEERKITLFRLTSLSSAIWPIGVISHSSSTWHFGRWCM